MGELGFWVFIAPALWNFGIIAVLVLVGLFLAGIDVVIDYLKSRGS